MHARVEWSGWIFGRIWQEWAQCIRASASQRMRVTGLSSPCVDGIPFSESALSTKKKRQHEPNVISDSQGNGWWYTQASKRWMAFASLFRWYMVNCKCFEVFKICYIKKQHFFSVLFLYFCIVKQLWPVIIVACPRHAVTHTASTDPTLRLAPYVGLLIWRASRTREERWSTSNGILQIFSGYDSPNIY